MKAEDDKAAIRERVQRERQQRRAEALRANLKRRKARGRGDSEESSTDASQSVPDPPET